MRILAFDTSGPWCAAALLIDGIIVDTRVEDMARGQAERLMLLLESTLHDAGMDWRDIDAIGVGTGPGNFTGIRISVAAARGLAMGLEAPVVGVSGFAARAACHPPDTPVGIPAPRETVYIADPEPRQIPVQDATGIITDTETAAVVAAIARIAAARCGDADLPLPAPLYVRPADAAPSRDAPPVLLD